MISQQISAVSEPILAFQFVFLSFRGQKINLLNYYQCLSQEFLALTKNFLQILKLVLAEFWRNAKLYAQNIALRCIYRVYPNHLFGYYTLVVRNKTICALEVVSDAQHKEEYVSQHSKRTRGKLASKLCHSSTIGVTRTISLVFELWKLALMGGTALQRGMFVDSSEFCF